MKNVLTILGCGMLLLNACTKQSDDVANLSQPSTTTSFAAKSSGSGGGGANNNNNTAGFINTVLSGSANRIIGGVTDSIYVQFTQPAPTGGWTLTLTSSNPAIQVPATYFVPAGKTIVYPHVTAASISSAQILTISVTLGVQTKTTTLKVFPPVYNAFPPPPLQSPGSGSQFDYHKFIAFQWSGNTNAYYSHLQFAYDAAFTNIEYDFIFDRTGYPLDYFDGTGVRYWRVRYLDASNNPGPWSPGRSFTIKPQ